MENQFTQEQIDDITLGGVKPLTNSFSYHHSRMGGEFFTGKVKVNKNLGLLMDISFVDGTEPTLKDGDFTMWIQEGIEWDCRIIRKRKVFIKGVWVVCMIIQFKEVIPCSD